MREARHTPSACMRNRISFASAVTVSVLVTVDRFASVNEEGVVLSLGTQCFLLVCFRAGCSAAGIHLGYSQQPPFEGRPVLSRTAEASRTDFIYSPVSLRSSEGTWRIVIHTPLHSGGQ